MTLAPNRHKRGWPRHSLLLHTSRSEYTFRVYVNAMGKVDGHDARGSTWEILEWAPVKIDSGTSPMKEDVV